MSKKQKMGVGVLGLPINVKGEYLLSQRHDPSNPIGHQSWQVAGGGMEFGETPEQTLARELEEELQVSANIIFPYPLVTTTHYTAEERQRDFDSHYTLLTYLVDIGDQKPNIGNDEETGDWGWFSISEIMELKCMPGSRELVFEADTLVRNRHLLDEISHIRQNSNQKM